MTDELPQGSLLSTLSCGFDYTQTRVIHISDLELDMDNPINDTLDTLWELNARSATDPITVVINSGGGSASQLCALLDVMRSLKAPVITQVLGLAASAASVLAACGTPGHRWMSPLSRMMIHQPRTTIMGDTTQAKIEVGVLVSLHDTVAAILSDATGRALRTVKRDLLRDNWMTADGALQYGIIDHIGIAPTLSDMPNFDALADDTE